MSLVTVQRSPTPTGRTSHDQTNSFDSACEESTSQASIGSECYFYVKGTAVILLHHDRVNIPHSSTDGEIEMHLQAMLRVLLPQDTLTMAVRLQWNSEAENDSCSAHYLVIVKSCSTPNEPRGCKHFESILLGLDCFPGERASLDYFKFGVLRIGVVIPIRTTTGVRLDGDGGIAVDCDSAVYLFRPVSVQAMWTVFQCLHKELRDAHKLHGTSVQSLRDGNHLFEYYLKHITTEDSLIAGWFVFLFLERSSLECTGDLGATAADAERFALERDDAEHREEIRIYDCLKEVMQTVDLDEVTSKDIRLKVQEIMNLNLDPYKAFISRQMLVIMGQLDKASQIFDYLYLGTEWNACDWEWLQKNRYGMIEYIVNVTNEVENFFPARLKYLKIRVSDEAGTELMKYWKQTYQFIKEAKEKGSAVLVHCKKGISRSSSTVIAFAMKEYGWGLEKAMEHVKKKRDCITPNKGFVEQLKIFEGILDAFKKRRKFDMPTSSNDILIRSNRQKEILHKKLVLGMNKDEVHLFFALIAAVSLLSYLMLIGKLQSENEMCKSPYCCERIDDEHGNLVKSLVGSFEAIGKAVKPFRTAKNLDIIPRPRLRLEKAADWKSRALVVSLPSACSNSAIHQAQVVTISQ
uniref:protein-serine/threonine phosphatase n=1 Tax=Syphacia muris TaxID=451379 RepID=A0A158R5G5_9BILA